MTIEEKAKAYDEAILKAEEFKEKYLNYKELNVHRDVIKDFDNIFPPGLTEIKDERIRKQLIQCFSELEDQESEWYENLTPKDIIAWLEKQGKQDVDRWYVCIEEFGNKEFKKGEIYPCINGWISNNKGYCAVSYSKYFQPVTEEEISTVKLQPIFKIGDTIRNKKTSEIFTISDYSLFYEYYHDISHLHEVRFSEQNDWELIEQLKEGDFVRFKEGNALGAKTDGIYEITSIYTSLGTNYKYAHIKNSKRNINDVCIDDLEKAEQKSIVVWSEEDENRFKNLYFLIDHSDENSPTKEGFKNWLKSLKDRNLPKQEWSEEDKKMVNDIVDCIKQLPIFYEKIEINDEQVLTSDFIPRARQWLSNLRYRKQYISEDVLREGITKYGITQYQIDNWLKPNIAIIPAKESWKPKEEYMKVLKRSIDYLQEYGKNDDYLVLNSLYDELKKL